MALTSPGNGKRKPGGFDLSGCAGATRRPTGARERERERGKGKEGRVEGRQRDTASYCAPLRLEGENKLRGKKRNREQTGQLLVLDRCGDEVSPQSSERSALLLAVLLEHPGSCREERLPLYQV